MLYVSLVLGVLGNLFAPLRVCLLVAVWLCVRVFACLYGCVFVCMVACLFSRLCACVFLCVCACLFDCGCSPICACLCVCVLCCLCCCFCLTAGSLFRKGKSSFVCCLMGWIACVFVVRCLLCAVTVCSIACMLGG